MTGLDSRDTPIYLRLRNRIATDILEGQYAEGGQIPSVRAFAAMAGANPLTVAKAYQCLQDEGVVQVRRGVGMFVVEGAAARLRLQERDTFLTQTWPEVRAHMARLDIAPEDLLGVRRA